MKEFGKVEGCVKIGSYQKEHPSNAGCVSDERPVILEMVSSTQGLGSMNYSLCKGWINL